MANNQIALMSQAPVLDTPFESQGKALQLRHLMNQGQLSDMEIQQHRQSLADMASSRQALIDNPTGGQGLLDAYGRSGNVAAYQAERKSAIDLGKTKAETGHIDAQTQESKVKTLNQALTIHRDQINTVNDKESAARWVKAAYDDPIMGSITSSHLGPMEDAINRIPDPKIDPAGFADWVKKSSLNADEFVKQTSLDANTKLRTDTDIKTTGMNNRTTLSANAATNATARANNAATVAATIAGNNKVQHVIAGDTAMTFNPSTGKFQVGTDTNGNPLPKTEKPLTEDQGKTSGWIVQAQNSFNNMRDAAKKTPSAVRPGFPDMIEAIPSAGAGGKLANMMRGEDRQKFMQGASSLSEALLHAATGAGFTKDEAINKAQELTPVFGEAEGTSKQKMDAIPLYLESLKMRAGKNAATKASKIVSDAANGTDIHSQADAILGGK